MGEFRMPSLGADMDVGTIIEWLVRPGDPVQRGQVVAVVDTAKAAMEIEAFESGVLEEILVDVGRQVPVGTPLAIIGAAAMATTPPLPGVPGVPGPPGVPAGPMVVDSVHSKVGIDYQSAAAAVPEPAPKRVGRRTRATPPAAPRATPQEHPRATPPVRHLAHQLGVDLDTIAGSGPEGHITHEDVLGAAQVEGVSVVAQGQPATEGALAGPESSSQPAGRLRVTPRARRLAAERGIDLSAVTGSGTRGAVLAGDVPVAAPPAPAPPAAGLGEVPGESRPHPVRAAPEAAGPGKAAGGGPAGAAVPRAADPERRAAMRAAIANLMSRSNAEIPHYYVQQTIDLGAGLAWLRAGNADLPPAQRLLPAVLFLRATVLAAEAVPELNGHWVDGRLRPADRVDLGVAVATRGGGLITPAIPDAGPLGIRELMARLADLVARARRGTLKQAEMAGATITVSSLGEAGPDALAGVIFPPQVALVGVGGIVERPWAVDGMLTVRPTCTITLAADHRASDGRTASAFLAVLAHALAHPEEM